MGVSIWEGKKAERVASALEMIAAANAASVDLTDEKAIQRIAKSGSASKFFNIGDQVSVKWNPDGGQTEYDYDQDVVAFYDVANADGNTVPGLWLQSHWGLPGVQFDAAEALVYAVTAVEANSTFHFSHSSALNDVAAGTYQFTLASAVPAGGQMMLVKNGSAWQIKTYASATSTEPIETVNCTSGSDGTDLGDIRSTSNSLMQVGKTAADLPAAAAVVINHGDITQYGYNRWSQSAIRQWMNSDAASGAWWVPKNVFDRPPAQLSSMRGFMAGLPADFLEIVRPVRVVTALNTVTDGGVSETTLDKFFLASIEQEYIVPQASGVEGAFWPYWKQRLGISSPQTSGSPNALAAHIRYSIEAHTSAQTVRLRSAVRGNASHVRAVTSTGNAGSNYSHATYAYRPAPACVIC